MTYVVSSSADIQNGFNSGDTDIFWDFAATTLVTGGYTWSPAPNSTLRGRGLISGYGDSDLTVITDNYAASTPLISILTGATGYLRICGITFKSGTGLVKEHGFVAVGGLCKKFLVDHCRINCLLSTNADLGMTVTGWVYGLAHRCTFDMSPNNTSEGINVGHDAYEFGGYSGFGHGAFADDTNFGTDKFMYVEECKQNNGTYFNDSSVGGRMVIRYSDFYNAKCQTHPTGSDANHASRGSRALELYKCSFSGPATCDGGAGFGTCIGYAVFFSSGCGLFWGNTFPNVPGQTYSAISYVVNIISMRRNKGTYTQNTTPNGWGFAGPVVQSGTVDVSGTAVTKVSGPNFNTSWPATPTGVTSMIVINGVAYEISSVNSISSITLRTGGGTQTGAAYTMGSAWDQNSDGLTGYAPLDQPGRGKTELLKFDFPSTINSVSGIISWPNQELEPLYEWGHSYTQVPFNYVGAHAIYPSGDTLIEGVDFFCGTGTTSVTGGVGSGLLTNRPGTANENEAYFATDDGPLGTLYRWRSGAWTLYYRPYTYPHPLTALESGSAPVSTTIPLLMGEGLT